MSAREQALHPRHELLRPEPARRLRRGVVVLRRHDVALLVDVHSELDDRRRDLMLVTGGRNRGHPFAMNNDLFHNTGESPSSPAPFHAIYALQPVWNP